MAISLQYTEKAYEILKDYDGDNPYIINLKNSVYAYKTLKLNDFHVEFILRNYNKETILINKVVKVAEWWGEKKKEEWGTDFTPTKLLVGWYVGDTRTTYVFYAKYRQSVDASLMFVPKSAILTDFLLEDWTKKEIDFSPYNERSGRKLYPHQEDAVKFLTTRKKAILADQMGFGKMEPVSSLIPTPNGFVKMGDLNVGDYIFGDDGKKHQILKTFPHKDKEIYTVHFSDGTSVDCGLEHLWLVKNNSWKGTKWRVLSVKEMLESGLKTGVKKSINKFQIPIAKPVDFEAKDLPINPYDLGVLLCNSDVIKENNKEMSILGLDVDEKSMFIPEDYKTASIEQRKELLSGLLDSCGFVTKGNKVHYKTKSLQMSKDVCEIICSLGGIVKIIGNENSKNDKNDEVYGINIEVPFNPFRLEEKFKRFNPSLRHSCKRYITNVTFSRVEDAKCLYVDSENHTYLTGKMYHVTHNTSSAIVASLVGGFKHVLIVCPASVKETWKNELKNYVDEDEITIVNGSNWDDSKFTIINYDILDNFYKIPTQKIKRKELNVDDDGNVITEVKEKEIVSRNTQVISSAMSKSQLFKSKFDLFIIDEAHRLSNSSSMRFKIIKDLLKRSQPDGIFELTGTMITNGAHNLYNLLKIIGCKITDDWESYMTKYCGAKVFYKKGPRAAYTNLFLKHYGKKSWSELSYDEKRQLDDVLEKKCPKVIIPGEDTNMDELQEIIKPYYLRRVTDDLKNMVDKNVKFLHYTLSEEEEESYNNTWDEYQSQLATEKEVKNSEKYKKLIEGTILRQWLADKMIPRTISLVRKCIEKGHKVIIFCAYDNEIDIFKKEFKGISVFHNGKISLKKKNDAVEQFQNDDNTKVFIGNIQSASVGLTLTAGDVVVFNNFSFTPSDNLQAENRIHRLNQTKPCTVYYQSFNGTYFDHMLDIVRGKQSVIDQIIVSEKEK